jgi:hypothetical protein
MSFPRRGGRPMFPQAFGAVHCSAPVSAERSFASGVCPLASSPISVPFRESRSNCRILLGLHSSAYDIYATDGSLEESTIGAPTRM